MAYIFDIFKYIFWTEKFCILVQISLRLVSEGNIDKKHSAANHYLNWPQYSKQAVPCKKCSHKQYIYIKHFGN